MVSNQRFYLRRAAEERTRAARALTEEARELHQRRDTLQFWSTLIAEARARRAAGEDLDDREVDEAIAELEVVLSQAGG